MTTPSKPMTESDEIMDPQYWAKLLYKTDFPEQIVPMQIADDDGYLTQGRAIVQRLSTLPQGREAALESQIKEMQAKLDDAESRVEELETEGQTVANEFEGDLWKVVRKLLNATHFDWSGLDNDSVSAEDAYEHLKECLDEANRPRKSGREAALEEALRPFVVPRDGAHSNARNDDSPVYVIDGHAITVGDFRRARRALKSATPQVERDGSGLSEEELQWLDWYAATRTFDGGVQRLLTMIGKLRNQLSAANEVVSTQNAVILKTIEKQIAAEQALARLTGGKS